MAFAWTFVACILVSAVAGQHQHWQRRVDGTLAPMKDFTFAAFDADRPLLEQFLQFPGRLDFYRFARVVQLAGGRTHQRHLGGFPVGSMPYPSMRSCSGKSIQHPARLRFRLGVCCSFWCFVLLGVFFKKKKKRRRRRRRRRNTKMCKATN